MINEYWYIGARRRRRRWPKILATIAVWVLVVAGLVWYGKEFARAIQIDRSKCMIHYVQGNTTTVREGRIIYEGQDLICRADV